MKRHRIRKEEIQMKESNYKSYDELPLFLNAATVAKVLGIAPSSSYELMHEKQRSQSTPTFCSAKIGRPSNAGRAIGKSVMRLG